MTITTVLAMTAAARATGLDTDTAILPPDGEYVSQQQYFEYTVPGLGAVTVQSPVLSRPYPGAIQQSIGTDEREIFDAMLLGVEIGQGLGLVQLTGPVEVMTTDRLLSTAGRFDAEIISASFTGNVGGMSITLREDPQRQSSGQTDITDLGGGLYHIDSFFDVFTELSIDGGAWITSNSSVRMTLVPEPATLGLLVLGGLTLLKRRLRIPDVL